MFKCLLFKNDWAAGKAEEATIKTNVPNNLLMYLFPIRHLQYKGKLNYV